MKSERSLSLRLQSAPLVAFAAGAAVCLNGGDACATSGSVAASNGANSIFNAPANGVKVFGGLASFHLGGFSVGYINSMAGGLNIVGVIGGSLIYHAPAGVAVAGLTNFLNFVYVGFSQSNNYIPMRFNSGGVRYGWVHCVSTNASGKQLRIDQWSYNASGGGIKTLDESITPKKLVLSDGRVKLNWSNANEDGVARYEVQAKGADGAWAAVDTATPGAGSYAATVSSNGAYRLVVENVDGASRELSF